MTKIANDRKENEAAAADLERTAKRIQSLLADLERRRREEEERRRQQAQTPGAEPAKPLTPYEGEFEQGTAGSTGRCAARSSAASATRSTPASAP